MAFWTSTAEAIRGAVRATLTPTRPPNIAGDLFHQAALRQRVDQPPRRAGRVRPVQPAPQPCQDHPRLPGSGRGAYSRWQPILCDSRLIGVRPVTGRPREERAEILHPDPLLTGAADSAGAAGSAGYAPESFQQLDGSGN